MTEPNYYELLGVARSASEADIKSAFRQEAKRNHPDQGGNPAIFRMIEDAYNTLSDPARRAVYDSSHGHAETITYTTDDFSYEEEAHPTSQWTDADWNDRSWQHEQPPTYEAREPQEEPVAQFHESRWDRFRYAVVDSPIWKRSYLLLGALAWIGAAVFFGWPAIPGVENSTVVKAFVLALLVYAFGSMLLRVAGVLIVLLALWNAQANDASAIDTALILAGGFALWLLGQWIFIWKNGFPRSIVAMGLLNAVKAPFDPHWHWERRRRFRNP